MNTSKLKAYAPQARKAFMAAVAQRANLLGIYRDRIADAVVAGELLQIEGRNYPASIATQRSELVLRVSKQGYDRLIDEMAYTWFNRFCAIRYMELHDFLGHGYRVLSHPQRSDGIQIIDHALDVASELQLDRDTLASLRLAGNQEEALFRMLLLAQCHALHQAMPFLFERLDDVSELLLPDNLLHSDSVLRQLVAAIPESDWQQVEVIGWLYQFYISEEKERVDAKIKSGETLTADEVAPKTQLFTPNWIVQYLVQNSIGRLWMMARPESTLIDQMPYYIPPGEQPPEVVANLQAAIEARIAADSSEGGVQLPESIRVLDPACGSGHILVEAYKLLRLIYLESGYPQRDIPKLILGNNLFGLDIDDRAAQLAGFALLMVGRDDNRRLFSNPQDLPRLNVFAIHNSDEVDSQTAIDAVIGAANPQAGGDLFGYGRIESVSPSAITAKELNALLGLFRQGKTFGSLLTVPAELAAVLPQLVKQLELLATTGNQLAKSYAGQLLHNYALPAQLLAQSYDAVIANPPYLGKGFSDALKSFAKCEFPDSKSDLFAMFIERGLQLSRESGYSAMVTMQSWMFLSSYEALRLRILEQTTIECMVHMGNNVMGIAFGTAATVMRKEANPTALGAYCYVGQDDIGEDNSPTTFPPQNERNLQASKRQRPA